MLNGSYISGTSGVVGFGKGCGAGARPHYPFFTVEQAKMECCKLGTDCVGFSWFKSQPVDKPGHGCFEKFRAELKHNPEVYGFVKNVSLPPRPQPACDVQANIKVTTYVEFGVRAIVVISSWCAGHARPVNLQIDWPALGMQPQQVSITKPALVGIQSAQNLKVGQELQISGEPNGGAILVVQPTKLSAMRTG